MSGTFTRRCPDCGDVRELRNDGHQKVGSTVIRRCRACNVRASLVHGGSLANRFTATPRTDIDEVVVLRLTGGRRDTPSNIAERLEATRRLFSHGLSGHQVAERIGVHPRTVWRYRRELAAE